MTTLLKTDQLLVSRQDPTTRAYTRVGTLSFDGHQYTFEYDRTTTRALPGLPFGKVHSSSSLFPIFAERVMDPHRPERVETLEHLGLPPDAQPFEILAVSGGGRTGDTYELTPLPQDGPVRLPFLVHGIRHLTDSERALIEGLDRGDQLQLRAETGNIVNDRALLVTQDGARLGYVPDPLLGYVHEIIKQDYELVVERVNPPVFGLHMRLLVRLNGEYSSTGAAND